MAMYYMSDHSAPSTRSRAERVEQDNSAVQKISKKVKKRKKQKVRKLFCLKRRLILIIMQNNRKMKLQRVRMSQRNMNLRHVVRVMSVNGKI